MHIRSDEVTVSNRETVFSMNVSDDQGDDEGESANGSRRNFSSLIQDSQLGAQQRIIDSVVRLLPLRPEMSRPDSWLRDEFC
jgi:hypothetical protein